MWSGRGSCWAKLGGERMGGGWGGPPLPYFWSQSPEERQVRGGLVAVITCLTDYSGKARVSLSCFGTRIFPFGFSDAPPSIGIEDSGTGSTSRA